VKQYSWNKVVERQSGRTHLDNVTYRYRKPMGASLPLETPDQRFFSIAKAPVNRYLNIVFLLGTKKAGQKRALFRPNCPARRSACAKLAALRQLHMREMSEN
jgi:hypothetical protein